ncbi:MAG TPA: NAD-dependent epimerase/dehydratase family protein [Bacteroidia bacterium]|nr:NAD-dependent epimerase/dehydratase family protein [Bacteroidia bacterium]
MILVTGGTGLVGSQLLYDLVKSGKKVKALKRPESNLSSVKKIFFTNGDASETLFNQIVWVNGDVRDLFSITEAMQDVDYVYHCAASVSFNSKDKKLLYQTNEEGTENIVNASLEKGIKKFCYVSSVATLGKAVNNELITEETFSKFLVDNSNYANSKYAAEREVWRAAAEGLNVVIVNPSIILGSGDWRKSSSAMFKKAYKGLPFYTSGSAGFIDVRDLSKIMIRLMESEITKERFIVSAENCSYKNLFEMICKEFGKKLPKLYATPFLTEIAWRLDLFKSKITGKNPILTKEIARASQEKNYFSNEKIKSALSYQFMPLDQSLKDICAIFSADISKK